MPCDRNVALEFGLRRQGARQTASFPYEIGEEFSPIARQFGLPSGMAAQEVFDRGYLMEECPLLVVNSQRVGERLDNKTGVPDRDKLDGFLRASAALKSFGLRPWRGLMEVETPSHSIKDRNQGWRTAEKLSPWRDQMHGHVDSCYGGCHHVVLGYHDSCYQDAKQARDKLVSLLGDRIRLQLLPIQGDVHGPREALPNHAGDRPDRARLRAECWQPFVKQVRRYLRDVRPSDRWRTDNCAAVVQTGRPIRSRRSRQQAGRKDHSSPESASAGPISVPVQGGGARRSRE